jgi:hypothetical protein
MEGAGVLGRMKRDQEQLQVGQIVPVLQVQVKPPDVFPHVASESQLLLPSLHSSRSTHPSVASTMKPSAQAQTNEPGVFVQKAPAAQRDGVTRHSLTSVQVAPSPSKPPGQPQVKVPKLLTQKPASAHGNERHSVEGKECVSDI